MPSQNQTASCQQQNIRVKSGLWDLSLKENLVTGAAAVAMKFESRRKINQERHVSPVVCSSDFARPGARVLGLSLICRRPSLRATHMEEWDFTTFDWGVARGAFGPALHPVPAA